MTLVNAVTDLILTLVEPENLYPRISKSYTDIHEREDLLRKIAGLGYRKRLKKRYGKDWEKYDDWFMKKWDWKP